MIEDYKEGIKKTLNKKSHQSLVIDGISLLLFKIHLIYSNKIQEYIGNHRSFNG